VGIDLSRREILGAAAMMGAVVAGCGQQGTLRRDPEPTEALSITKRRPTRIRKVYLAKPVPTWPKPSLDVAAEVKRIDGILAGMSDRMDGIQLEGRDLYRVPEEVPESAQALGNPDGLLVFNLTSTVGQHLQRLTSTGLPTVLFSQPYSGHDWSAVAPLQKAGQRIICLASSDFRGIPDTLRLVRTIHLMRQTRIVHLSTGPYGSERTAQIREKLGPTVVSITPDRFDAAYRAVSEQAARAEAQEWARGAVKVIEPSEADLIASGRLYLALRAIMAEEQAQAVTVNCLGMFKEKRLPAYPCLAFAKLNDIGLTGVCEADIDSTLTQMIFTYAFGVPGFVSDPVVDISNNTIIHAHCVSATKMDGPGGPRAPYIVRSHLEDNKGASLQVKMRLQQVITVAKLVDLETMLISTGTIIDNPDLDRGCRTKITTKVADARKVMNNYTGGLHRVIVYGDRVNAIRDLAALMQFSIVEEC
jgi:hypothetical protein